ncbi:MAG: beta-lactamase family protein [Pseudomonadales bacterium]|nr:beta-lactamase family protein [Pseudomonadales bacterium]
MSLSKRMLATLAFVLLFPLAGQADGFAETFERDYVLPLIKDAPGAALVIVENGKVVRQETYGVRQVNSSDLVTSETLFRIASLSKTFASAAASILVEDTPLTWHTPLKTNLADLRFKQSDYGDQISLYHLMSQSTGLMPHAYTNLIEENMSFQRIVDRLDRVDFVCEPGRCYGYQNVVFSLVGDLVERETSMPYQDYVSRQIFQPLDMSRASFGYKEFIEDQNHARPHVWNGKRWVSVKPTPHYYKVPPAAGVNASISDLTSWLLAQLGQNPDVLPEDMLAEMHQGVIKTSRYQAHYPKRKALGDIYYGLGWRVFDYGSQSGFVHHGGYVKGMCSSMVFHRETGTGMVLLTNSEPRDINQLVLDFAELHDKMFRGLPLRVAGR